MKKSTVAVYKSNETAIKAVKHLIKHGIAEEELSIVGKGDLIEDHIHFVPVKKYKIAPIIIGLGVGGLLGGLSGAGMLQLPLFEQFSDAGFFIGLLAGIGIGAAIGALITVIASIVVKKDEIVVLQKHIDNGSYAVVVKGSDADIAKSKELLHQSKHGHHHLVQLHGK